MTTSVQPARSGSRAGELLLGRQWAMLPDRLPALLALADKVLADPAALTAWADAPVPETYLATIRDGVATLPVTGILTRQWSFWSWWWGGTTYEVIARDLEKLQADPSVRAVILEFDTPGGEVAGCDELAGLIRAFDEQKPIIAHAAATCCSAGYWLASACRDVIADPTAVVGSIGVISEFVDVRGWKEFEGIEWIEIVSSQSPRKAMDPATPTGRADWQELLDALAAVFVATVARHRGVDEATVLDDFGQGGVFVGAGAIDAGLADALGTHARVHAALVEQIAAATDLSTLALREVLMPTASTRTSSRRRGAPGASNPAPRPTAEMTDEEEEKPEGQGEEEEEDEEEEEEEEQAKASAVALRKARAAGAKAERERIVAIVELGAKQKGAKVQERVAAAIRDPDMTAEKLALQLLTDGSVSAAGTSYLEGRAGDEAALTAPSNAGGATPVGPEAEGEEQLVKSIVSLYNQHARPRQAAAGRN